MSRPLYVARHARETGVSQPGLPSAQCAERGCTTHTFDWRHPKGSPENTHGVVACYEPTSVEVLRERRYRSEAHFVAYEVFDRETDEPLGRQPRVRKVALPWLRGLGFDVRVGWLLADVDTPRHEPWTTETRAEFDALWQRAEGPLATCGAYLSPKGYRLMQPLAEPLIAERAERALHAWLEELVAVGVWPSVREARDWTRHMRTPHHLRLGASVTSPWQDWSRCALITAKVPDAVERPPVRRRVGTTHPRPVEHFDETCPPGWETVAAAVGAAIRDHVRSDWRRCYLAVSGSLLARGCPPEAVPAVVGAAHLVDPQWEHLLHDRVQIARDTVVKWSADVEISGPAQLRRHWALVADALDRATSTGSEASILRQVASSERRIIDLTDATTTLRAEIRDAYGATLISGPPGLGKTEAVIEYARGLAAIEGRAKSGQRIALSCPTTRLAQEIEQRAKARGVKTLRVFGSISHQDEDGAFTCIHRERALPLVQGGQSLETLFCAPEGQSPCEKAEVCPARSGKVGSDDANLVLGPHELLGRLAVYAGKGGTIVMDEPPALVESFALPLEHVERTLDALDAFAPQYARDMRPAMTAILEWARAAEPGHYATGAEAVAYGASSIPRAELPPGVVALPEDRLAEGVLVCAQRAREEARTIVPPLTKSAAAHARRSAARAIELGRASEMLLAIYSALQPPAEGLEPTRLRVVQKEDRRILSFVGPNSLAIETLRRDAPTVLLDAGADLLALSVERIVGYRPRLVELDVADGAPVSRTVIATSRATRKGLHRDGALDLRVAVPLLRTALSWADEGEPGTTLVVVSWFDVEALLLHALEDARAPKLLKRAGITEAAAEEARRRLADSVRPWHGRIQTAHFGALRGLDVYRDFDALVTLGDPRPPVAEECDKAAWIGVDPDGRLDALAAAELDQAHGRLRLIHRRKPARALHLGGVLPAGWRGRNVEVRRLVGGRPRNVPSTQIDAKTLRDQRVEKGLSLQEFATMCGTSKNSLSRYERGVSSIPDELATRFLEVLSMHPSGRTRNPL